MKEAPRWPGWMRWALMALLFGSITVMWLPSRWVVASFQFCIFVLACIWLGAWWRHGLKAETSGVLVPLGVAVVWGLAQVALGTTVYRWATEDAVLDWSARFVVFFLSLQLCSEGEKRRAMLTFALWFGFALAAVATLQRFTADGKIFWLFDGGIAGTAMGPFVYHNQYAAFVELVLPLALVAALRQPHKLLYAAMASVMIASVVAANSRAGIALVAGETFLILLLARKRGIASNRGVWITVAGTALFLAVFVLAVGWRPLWDKFGQSDSYRDRGALLVSSLQMARDRPWMGFGLGTWSTAYPAYARFDDGLFDNQAHNDWVQWAVEGGIGFFLLMVWMGAALARAGLQSLWGAGLASVLLHGLIDYPFQQRPAFGYFFFVLAALAVSHRKHGSGTMRDDALANRG